MNADPSPIANWLGAITGAVTLVVWTYNCFKYFGRHLAQTREHAVLSEKLAQDLASKATNAERRSDIHTYFTLQAIRTIARRQVVLFGYLGNGVFFSALLFYGKSQGFVPLAKDAEWRAWVYNGFILLIAIAIASLAWIDRSLRKIEDGWQLGVDKSLRQKLVKHI